MLYFTNNIYVKLSKNCEIYNQKIEILCTNNSNSITIFSEE